MENRIPGLRPIRPKNVRRRRRRSSTLAKAAAAHNMEPQDYLVAQAEQSEDVEELATRLGVAVRQVYRYLMTYQVRWDKA